MLKAILGLSLALVPDPVAKPIDPSSWIGVNDYPRASLKRLESGMVGYALTIDRQGIVTSCKITLSSGFGLLDGATCALVKQRGRFVVPTDAGGHPRASVFSGRVRWTIPVPVPAISSVASANVANPFPRVPGTYGQWSPPYPRRLAPSFFPSIAALAAMPAAAIDVADDASPPADPAVRYGQLPNGLHYAIRHSALAYAPVSLRLQIAAGSLDETDHQRGYAHFVEHMTFRGSTAVPDGQFAKSLERMGLELGTDTTANTTIESTIFGLDLPASTRSPITSGFFLLRQAVDCATIAPAAVASERGVVLSELRQRDDPALRADQARLGFLLAGQPVPARWPAGTPASLAAATATGLREFYRAHYRPANATLVVVGDIDPDRTESDIKAAFGDWTAKGGEVPAVGQGHTQPRPQQILLHVEPGAPLTAEASWVSDYDPSADTLGRERHETAMAVAMFVLNERLARLAEEPAAPFVGASVRRGPNYHSAMVTTLGAVPKAGLTGAALAAMLTERRRLVQFGITKAELDRATAQIRAEIARAVAGAPARGSNELANTILQSLDYHAVFTSPAQGAADAEKILSALTPADIAADFPQLFAGSGPLIFVSGDSAPAGGQAALSAAIAQADAQAITARPELTTAAWPYTHFGAIGQVVGRQHIPDLDVTIARFANGNSVTIKQLGSPADQIMVNLNFGAGFAGLPKGLERSYWQITSGVSTFLMGGLGKVSTADLSEQFAGRRVGLQFGVDDRRFAISGETRRADLDAQLQIMTAYVADPGFGPAAFERARSLVQTIIAQADSSATMAAQRDLPFLLNARDDRWAVNPTPTDLATARSGDLAAILRPALAGPINMVIVGDVDVERAITAAQATIGALPPRAARLAAPVSSFPTVPPKPVVLVEHGSANDAVAIAAWPIPGLYANLADARAVQVLAKVIEGRLFDGLREVDGLTYSPSVLTNQSEVFPNYGSLAVDVELPPDKTEHYFATISAIIANLATQPIAVEELDRARQPMLDASRLQQHYLNYWLSELVGADEDPRVFDTIRSRLPDLTAITPADIQRLTRDYLAGKAPYRIIFSAEPKR